VTDRICVAGCGRTISRQSKKGLCRSCAAKRLNSDPAIVAKRKANVQRYYDTPGVREEHARRLARHMANMSPEEIERRREHGRRTAREVLARPDVRAKSNGREAKRIAGIHRSATVLSWCPPEWRDRYRELCKRGRRAPEARRMVLAEIEEAERARWEAMTPFERQLERVRNGATLIEKPDFSRPITATLGGVSAGML
jgi:hypothetical protein